MEKTYSILKVLPLSRILNGKVLVENIMFDKMLSGWRKVNIHSRKERFSLIYCYFMKYKSFYILRISFFLFPVSGSTRDAYI